MRVRLACFATARILPSTGARTEPSDAALPGVSAEPERRVERTGRPCSAGSKGAFGMAFSRREWLQLSAASVVPAAWGGARLLAQTPAPAGQAPAQAPPKTEFVDVRRNVSIFTGQGGTIGLLVNPGGLAVVDTQFPATAQICLDGLKTRAAAAPDRSRHQHPPSRRSHRRQRRASRCGQDDRCACQGARADEGRCGAPDPAQRAGANLSRLDVSRDVQGRPRRRGGFGASHYGPAHTGGDIVVLFEKANVAHMGDLTFNRRHPFIDRPGGASIAGWITLLEQVSKAHAADTIFVFGHAGDGWKVTGAKADLLVQRDYFTALLELRARRGEGRQVEGRHHQNQRGAERVHRSRPADRACDGRGLRRNRCVSS